MARKVAKNLFKTKNGRFFRKDRKGRARFVSKRVVSRKLNKKKRKRTSKSKTIKRSNTTSSNKRRKKVARRGKLQRNIARGVGAGLTGSANAIVAQFFGLNVGEDLAAIGLGTALDMGSKGVFKDAGQGMQIAGIAGLVRDIVGGGLGGNLGGLFNGGAA